MEQVRMQAKTGEIISVLPDRGFSIIRTFEDGQQFYGHFSAYTSNNEREIQKGVIVKFQSTGKKPEGKARPTALLIEIARGETA